MVAGRKHLALAAVAVAALCIAAWLAVPAGKNKLSAVAGAIMARADPIGPEPPRFFYRVKADVTFDGKPYTIDNWVACNTKRFYGPDVGAHWGYEGSIESLGVRTADGGALFIKTPDLCRPAWRRHKALQGGEPDTPPLSEVSAPANHLPEFYWFNDADKPTLVEAYLSDIYYQRPDRRLTINAVEVGSVGLEPPVGVEVIDFGKKIPDPYNPCELVRPYAAHYSREKYVCFGGYGAFPYAEDEWRVSSGLVEFADKAPQDRLTPVSLEYWREHHVSGDTIRKKLYRPSTLAVQDKLETAYENGFGIPRFEETAAGNCSSMLAPVSGDSCRNLRFFDKVLPIVCEDANCSLIEDEPGVYFFKSYPRPFPDKVLDVRGRSILLPGGEFAGWYDPSTKTFWWVVTGIGL